MFLLYYEITRELLSIVKCVYLKCILIPKNVLYINSHKRRLASRSISRNRKRDDMDVFVPCALFTYTWWDHEEITRVLLPSRKDGRRSNAIPPFAQRGQGVPARSRAHALQRTRIIHECTCTCVSFERAWAMLWHATRPLRTEPASWIATRKEGVKFRRGTGGRLQRPLYTRAHTYTRETRRARIYIR